MYAMGILTNGVYSSSFQHPERGRTWSYLWSAARPNHGDLWIQTVAAVWKFWVQALVVWQKARVHEHEARQGSKDKRIHALEYGTKTAFRQVAASERLLEWIFKSKHPLGSEFSWSNYQLDRTTKNHSTWSECHAGTTQVNFEADHQPPADSPPKDHLITVVKLKKVNIVRISHRFHSAKSLLTATLPVTVLKVQTCKKCKENFARTPTATH